MTAIFWSISMQKVTYPVDKDETNQTAVFIEMTHMDWGSIQR